MKKIHLFSIVAVLISYSTFCQNSTSNTIFYSDSTASPKASLSAISWIQGHWQGEAFGGTTEEIWTPPLGHSMMGAFKLTADNQVKFYEIMTISEVDQTLLLRIKHFHADLKGWEEKDETIDFKLVKVTDDKVFFDGLTFEKVNDNEINVYVVTNHNDSDAQKEVKFHYKKVR